METWIYRHGRVGGSIRDHEYVPIIPGLVMNKPEVAIRLRMQHDETRSYSFWDEDGQLHWYDPMASHPLS
jgi:hypothetical protein